MSIDNVIEIADDSKLGGSGSVGLVETQTWTFDDPLPLDCGRAPEPGHPGL